MGGGNYYTLGQIRSLTDTARSLGLRAHLDGARLFNVLVETGDDPKEHGACFDSISICLSKGLGAPVGSVLISDAATISQARRIRKVMGGGMRQAGYLAAAGIYALDHQVKRLADDHRHARECAEKLRSASWVSEVYPVFTNIVIFRVATGTTSAAIVSQLAKYDIHCHAVNDSLVRWVFHLDITRDMVRRILELPEQLI
jgi:threonine aldolase